MRTAPGPQFIRLSKYNCTASPRSSTPFINPNLLVSDTTPHLSYYCADPMGLLLQDKWIDPSVQHLWVSGTYKLQLFWFGYIFFPCVRPLTSSAFLGRQGDLPLYPIASRLGKMIEERKGGGTPKKDHFTQVN